MELEHDSLWQAYAAMFKKACQKHDWLHAKLALDHAFIDAEQFAEIDDRIVWCLFSLVSWYLSYGNYGKANQLYKRLLELKKKILGRTYPVGMDSLEKLAFLQMKDLQREQVSTLKPFARYASSTASSA